MYAVDGGVFYLCEYIHTGFKIGRETRWNRLSIFCSRCRETKIYKHRFTMQRLIYKKLYTEGLTQQPPRFRLMYNNASKWKVFQCDWGGVVRRGSDRGWVRRTLYSVVKAMQTNEFLVYILISVRIIIHFGMDGLDCLIQLCTYIDFIILILLMIAMCIFLLGHQRIIIKC